jgi:hypothetical protein
MMRDGDGCGLMLFVAFATVTAMVGGCKVGQSMVRIDAIEAGVAKWVIDSQTGVRQFEWVVQRRNDEPPVTTEQSP